VKIGSIDKRDQAGMEFPRLRLNPMLKVFPFLDRMANGSFSLLFAENPSLISSLPIYMSVSLKKRKAEDVSAPKLLAHCDVIYDG